MIVTPRGNRRGFEQKVLISTEVRVKALLYFHSTQVPTAENTE